MGFFSDIRDKIFHRQHQTTAQTAPVSPSPTAAAPAGQAPSAPSSQPAVAPAQTAAASSTSSTPATAVDVATILDKAAKDSGQTLNWRTSIVDLMKALDIDSSLAARKSLATELDYTGDTNDSASMNIWLHKQVLRKLADNGGVVPAELLD